MSWLKNSFIPHVDLDHKAMNQHNSVKLIENDQPAFNVISARISALRILSNPTGTFARRFLGATLLALICSPASTLGTGKLDLGICCMQAARSQFPATITDTPWKACGTDPDFVFSDSSDPSPSVNVTLKWCMEHCSGWQASKAEQWLQPLAVWFIPALALLILCSVGEDEEDENGIPFRNQIYQTKEYIILLGDPVSSIGGGFSELWIDTWLAREILKMNMKDDHDDVSFNELVIGIAMLTIQTSFSVPKFPAISKHVDEEHQRPNEKSPVHYRPDDDLREAARAAFNNYAFQGNLLTGIKTVLAARINFVNGVALPVVLALAATASTFHDAYLDLGNNETAFNLAFGIWFSWLIILAVVSNSYVASVNPAVAQDAIGNLFTFSHCTLPLRKRAKNTILWRQWVIAIMEGSSDKSLSADFTNYHPTTLQFRSLPGYLIRQVIAWICVAFACACAAVITYRTPPVGIGCRSFTFLIYGILTFIVASLTALRDWVGTKSPIRNPLRHLYGFLVSLTALVLVLSVLAELIGLYRNCWCMHFGPSSDLVELSTGTELSIRNATKTWIPVGFVAYTGAWVVGAVAVAFRGFINFRLQDMMG